MVRRMLRRTSSWIRSWARPRPLRGTLAAGLGVGLLGGLLGGLAGCSEPTAATPLGAEVDVLVDAMGVPHVYAESDADAFFAAGYTMARLRLFQIELVRRQARGTASEILGEKALRADLLARTLDFVRWGKKSREAVQLDDPRAAQLIESWVRGINRHISRVRSGEAPRPAEMAAGAADFLPTPWTDEDPYIIGKMLSYGMSSSLDYELLASALGKAAPAFPPDFPLCRPTRDAFTVPGTSPSVLAGTPPPAEARPRPRLLDPATEAALRRALARYERLIPETGSNNWAVAARHTDSGRPLVAGDPHQPLGSPLRFYVQHLNSADAFGGLDVVGFSFAGTPGVQLGHNRKLAWTATTNFADVMDLWEVKRSGDAILVGGREQKGAQRTERIRVRAMSGPAALEEGQGDTREFTLLDVPGLGVLLPDDLLPVPKALLVADPRAEILLNWTGFAATHEASMYLGLDRAGSLDEWERAARQLEVGAVNLVAADAKDIRYRVWASVPDRGDAHRQGIQPWRLMRGDDPKTLWRGKFLDESRLPASRNPERGYLATANNDPWGFTADGRVDNDPFYYGYFFDPGDRASRIESELKRLVGRGKVSQADLATLQLDARSTLADDLLPALGQAMSELGTDEALKPFRGRPELFELANRLSAWDRQMRRGSSEAVIFYAFAHFALKRGLADDLGPFFGTLLSAEPAFGFKPLRLALRKVPGTEGLLQEGRNVVLVGGLADAADFLKQRFGTVLPTMAMPYAWKDVHAAGFSHVLGGDFDAGEFPVDGSVGTVNVSAGSLIDASGKVQGRSVSRAGSIYRMIASFDEDGTPRAVVNFPRGNDEDKKSPFYANTHQAWLDGRHEPLLYRRSDIESHVMQRFSLSREGLER